MQQQYKNLAVILVILLQVFNSFAQDYQGVQIIVETRQADTSVSVTGQDEEFANNLKAQFDSAPQPSGYCTKENPTFPVTNGNVCGGGNQNIMWKFQFIFRDSVNSDWLIEFGVDIGLGTSIFIDGDWYLNRYDDLWWANNWNSNAVFRINQQLTAGQHVIEVYGKEACCDGGMDVRFSKNGGDFKRLTKENVETQIDEQVGECAVLYSECDFSGEALDVCESNPDISDFIVKSIYVPEGQTIILHNQLSYQGKEVEFQQSVTCIDELDFSNPSFLEINRINLQEIQEEPVALESQKSHLRKN